MSARNWDLSLAGGSEKHRGKTQNWTGPVVNPGPYWDFAKRSAIS
jgi:hypothetical protein